MAYELNYWVEIQGKSPQENPNGKHAANMDRCNNTINDALTITNQTMGKYEKAIVSWIKTISDNVSDLELIDGWLKSSPPHPHGSMNDAIDSLFDFGMIVDEATFLGLMDLYARMETAITTGNTPWKYVRQHQAMPTQVADEEAADLNTTAQHVKDEQAFVLRKDLAPLKQSNTEDRPQGHPNTCNILVSDSESDTESDLEAEDTPFPAQSHKSLGGNNNVEIGNYHHNATKCTKGNNDYDYLNIISEDEGDDYESDSVATDSTNTRADEESKDNKSQGNCLMPWPKMRKRIKQHAIVKKENKKRAANKWYREQQEWAPYHARPSPKGNSGRVIHQNNEENMLPGGGDIESWEEPLGPPSPTGNFGRVTTTTKTRAGQKNGKTIIVHPPKTKYNIVRIGKILKLYNKQQPPTGGTTDRPNRTHTIEQDDRQPSSTGNLGRAGTEQSSSKGNLGRMGCRMANTKLELIVWQLQKKGIATN